MKRTSSATWRGDGMTGVGTLATQSGVLDHQPYSFKGRFVSEDGHAGTNPEELLAAAHAGCFSMAMAFALTSVGHPPQELVTQAAVDMHQVDGQFAITGIVLMLRAKVSGISSEEFQAYAAAAMSSCPMSKALASVPLSLVAELV